MIGNAFSYIVLGSNAGAPIWQYIGAEPQLADCLLADLRILSCMHRPIQPKSLS
jgi:hypothetical protein